jgi:hypothetical protein
MSARTAEAERQVRDETGRKVAARFACAFDKKVANQSRLSLLLEGMCGIFSIVGFPTEKRSRFKQELFQNVNVA